MLEKKIYINATSIISKIVTSESANNLFSSAKKEYERLVKINNLIQNFYEVGSDFS